MAGMSDWNLTLVEYHSHGDGPQLFPDVFSRGSSEPAEPAEDGGGSGATWIAVLATLVVLVGIGVALRYLRGEEESTLGGEQVEVTEYED